ncbi:MAG: RNA 2',3'-cyclic phosphodiesterase [Wenzhouxiangellaceae bacterium]|nr:RNA 2',3'-cyclic phosphodiesterase [Wenzhouxiangellaceae bacterium]
MNARWLAGTRRLFFALWPDAGLRDAIAVRAARLEGLPGRPVPATNFHVTLVFLGDVPESKVDDYAAAVPDRPAQAFTLVLDRLGWFPRARVCWLGGEAPAAGRSLVESLAAALEPLGHEPERRPWRPHVTLLRGARRPPSVRDVEPVAWPAGDFALVESVPGRPYQVLRSWPLQS